MADEATEEKSEKKGGGNLLLIVLIVLIVLLLGAVGALGYFMYSKGVFGDQPQTQQQQQQQVEQKAPEEDDGERFEAKIEGLVLNVTDAKGRAHLMKLSFSISSTEPTIAAIVEANKDKIIDSVIALVSARSTEELLTVGGKAMLKEEMLEDINNILNDTITEDSDVKKDSVKGIYFTSFVMK